MTAVPANPLDRIRPDVRAMHAYTVQAADGLLSHNEVRPVVDSIVGDFAEFINLDVVEKVVTQLPLASYTPKEI